MQGSVIGTLGNFSASIGKAKSKKTFNVSAIVAAALKNGTVLRYVAELPEEKRKILYVDTEQSPYHCLKVMKRILRLAGLLDDRDNEHLEFLALRKYTPEQRIRIVDSVSSLLFSRISLCSSTVGANSSRSDFAHRTASVSSFAGLRIHFRPPKPQYLWSMARSSVVAVLCSLSRMNAVRIASMLSRSFCLRLNAIFV